MREAVAGGLGLAAGVAIAWMDTRPTWDDTGITAAALVLVAAGAAVAGVRPWLAAGLTVLPLAAAEVRGAGPMMMLPVAVALAGAYAGWLLRRAGFGWGTHG